MTSWPGYLFFLQTKSRSVKRRRCILTLLTRRPQVIFSCASLQQSLVTVVCLTSHRDGVTRYSQGTCLEIRVAVRSLAHLQQTQWMMSVTYMKIED